jgi:hypothetical protein
MPFTTTRESSNKVLFDPVFCITVVVIPEIVSCSNMQRSVPFEGSNCGKLMVDVDALVVFRIAVCDIVAGAVPPEQEHWAKIFCGLVTAINMQKIAKRK